MNNHKSSYDTILQYTRYHMRIFTKLRGWPVYIEVGYVELYHSIASTLLRLVNLNKVLFGKLCFKVKRSLANCKVSWSRLKHDFWQLQYVWWSWTTLLGYYIATESNQLPKIYCIILVSVSEGISYQTATMTPRIGRAYQNSSTVFGSVIFNTYTYKTKFVTPINKHLKSRSTNMFSHASVHLYMITIWQKTNT